MTRPRPRRTLLPRGVAQERLVRIVDRPASRSPQGEPNESVSSVHLSTPIAIPLPVARRLMPPIRSGLVIRYA